MSTDALIQPVPEIIARALVHFTNEDNEPDESDLRELKCAFDQLGPYTFAKTYGLLINNSGEEFAFQFMSYMNLYQVSY